MSHTHEKEKSSNLYRPKRAFGDGETRPEKELGDFSNKPFCVLPVIPQNVLGYGGVADDNKIPRPGGESVNGSVVVHPFEERKKQSAAEEIGDVVELGAGNGNSRVGVSAEC
ncbi:hypothetical protein TIFTF001_008508 [Ficus carica]|uniref:Uncharacterized protein n=1 Tax=Ficus carica TaxID=3494 RepID=A0AA87ZV05_FICCA|nr:hypothetical protein TIFTF001_008508 [Ficus carica]